MLLLLSYQSYHNYISGQVIDYTYIQLCSMMMMMMLSFQRMMNAAFVLHPNYCI